MVATIVGHIEVGVVVPMGNMEVLDYTLLYLPYRTRWVFTSPCLSPTGGPHAI